MTNFILRFANFDNFQPYLGPGIGAYCANRELDDVHVDGQTFTVGGGSSPFTGLGWHRRGHYLLEPQVGTFIDQLHEYVALDLGNGNRQIRSAADRRWFQVRLSLP